MRAVQMQTNIQVKPPACGTRHHYSPSRPEPTHACGRTMHVLHVLLDYADCMAKSLPSRPSKPLHHAVLPACQALLSPKALNLILPDETQLGASKPDAAAAAGTAAACASPVAAIRSDTSRRRSSGSTAARPCTPPSEEHHCPTHPFGAARHQVGIPCSQDKAVQQQQRQRQCVRG